MRDEGEERRRYNPPGAVTRPGRPVIVCNQNAVSFLPSPTPVDHGGLAKPPYLINLGAQVLWVQIQLWLGGNIIKLQGYRVEGPDLSAGQGNTHWTPRQPPRRACLPGYQPPRVHRVGRSHQGHARDSTAPSPDLPAQLTAELKMRKISEDSLLTIVFSLVSHRMGTVYFPAAERIARGFGELDWWHGPCSSIDIGPRGVRLPGCTQLLGPMHWEAGRPIVWAHVPGKPCPCVSPLWLKGSPHACHQAIRLHIQPSQPHHPRNILPNVSSASSYSCLTFLAW